MNFPGEPPGGLRNTLYQRVTKSQRRLTRGRLLLYRAAIVLGKSLLFLFWRSYRIQVLGDEPFDRAIREHGAVIPCCWHQGSMVCVPYLLTKRAHGLKIGFLISPSVDGEGPAMLAQRLGAHVIRGSATNTGARALRDFYLAIAKENISPYINPDGPRGPRYEFKSGALMISQLVGKPIVPISFCASRVWRLRSWDRFVVPWLFSRVVIAVGEPVQVSRVLKPDDLPAMQAKLGQELQELYERAREKLAES